MKQARFAGNTRIVHGEMEPAELLRRAIDRFADLLEVRDVPLQRAQTG